MFDTTSEQVDTDTGEVTPPKVATLEAMREQVEAVIPRQELAAGSPPCLSRHRRWTRKRTRVGERCWITRFGTVWPFLRLLAETAADGAAPVVLAAGAQQAEPGRRLAGSVPNRLV